MEFCFLAYFVCFSYSNSSEGIIMQSFKKELTALINYHSKENGSDTPDFILANYLARCLQAFDETEKERQDWYSDRNFCSSCEGHGATLDGEICPHCEGSGNK